MRLIAGRFALIDPIGHGGSGAVWRAFDQREAKYCAVKVVKHGNAEWLPRVVREQGVRLTHPHVVSPYAWAADEDVLVAMDLLRGGSLATLVSDHGALPGHYAARLLGQLLAALDHVHAAGLIHRDVKPSNVLLEPTGQGPPQSRLGDFGLAIPRAGPRLTETGSVMGTRGYLSPEALEGAVPDVAQDLYAAGVVAWQLLTGSQDAPGLVPDPAPPPGVAPSLWSLVLDLLAFEPQRRPPDAASALRQLALSGRGEPIEVPDVIGPLPRRPPVPALAAAATVIMLIAVLLLIDGGQDASGDAGTGPGTANTAAPTQTTAPAGTVASSTTPATTTPGTQPPLPGVAAGERCGWQDVGSRETAEDGRPVECVYDGREYHWEPVDAGSQ